MKRLSKDELDVILAEHEKWIVDKQTGRQAFFEGVEFSDFNFPSNCMVSRCKVSGCTVYNCTVTDCKVSGGTVYNCTVTDCKVSYCKVTNCKVSYCKVSGGTVYNCTVFGCTFSGCTVSDCTVTDCTVFGCTVSNCTVFHCKVSTCKVSGCTVFGCTVFGCKVSDCTVTDCTVFGKPAIEIKGFSGLYKYNVWAVLFADGSRWVKMGCLFYSLDEWERIGIRKSNMSEFPNDSSEKCEERVRAFEFAKATALAMKVTESAQKESE